MIDPPGLRGLGVTFLNFVRCNGMSGRILSLSGVQVRGEGTGKTDKQFVKDIVDDPIDFAMVRSINEIGHVMGKQTIAEFVENDDILEKLREIGVDYAQGYGIGRPRPIEEITRGIKVEGMSPVGRVVKQASGGGRKK